METLGNLNITLSRVYKKKDLPNIELGDTVNVVIYLELPKEVAEGEKKENGDGEYVVPSDIVEYKKPKI